MNPPQKLHVNISVVLKTRKDLALSHLLNFFFFPIIVLVITVPLPSNTAPKGQLLELQDIRRRSGLSCEAKSTSPPATQAAPSNKKSMQFPRLFSGST